METRAIGIFHGPAGLWQLSVVGEKAEGILKQVFLKSKALLLPFLPTALDLWFCLNRLGWDTHMYHLHMLPVSSCPAHWVPELCCLSQCPDLQNGCSVLGSCAKRCLSSQVRARKAKSLLNILSCLANTKKSLLNKCHD